jgi:hypothetical protein
MIRDMTQPITVEMVIQEINRYADSEFRYADKSDEVAIENAVRDMGRSAASELFIIEFEISFLPIIAGLVIAALASIWHIGVDMRDELDATI